MRRRNLGELRWGWIIAIAIALALLLFGHLAAGTVVNIVGGLIAPGVFIKVAPLLYYVEGDAAHLAQMLTHAAVIVLIICLFKLLYRKPAAKMGFGMRGAGRKFFIGLLWGAAYMAVIFVALFAFGGLTVNAVTPARLLSPGILMGVGGFLIAALHEETLTRGFMMSVLKPTRVRAFVILVPALIFGLAHLSNPGFTTLPLINIFLAGLLFAILFLRSGSLWMPFGFHYAWNFFQGNIFGIRVSGMEFDSMITSVYTEKALLNGGDFGAEGGLVVTVVLALGIILTWKFMPTAKDAQWSIEEDPPLTRRVFGEDAETEGEPQPGA